MTGNMIYGTEGWAAMSDQGFQAFKGESSEMIMELRPERGPNGEDPTSLHMRISWPPAARKKEPARRAQQRGVSAHHVPPREYSTASAAG